MSNFTPTERTKVHRKPDRGSYERELIYSILDEAFVCQVGFISDGWPFVVPTNYVRVGDKLFLHGSTASRLMRTLSSGAPFCLNVTLLDGIVCAPTASGHSVNYRSVVVMGKAERVEVEAAKLAAMRDFVEYVIRGRWATVRAPSEQELKGTMVLAVPLVEAKSPDARPAQGVPGIRGYGRPGRLGATNDKGLEESRRAAALLRVPQRRPLRLAEGLRRAAPGPLARRAEAREVAQTSACANVMP
jgi:nitroimidazol reductase NimA-like FMN-containing flavoprotein (pyridoxamine 5'-phosphate oxidase superfamily)